jgi:TetR/AcrR family transcriptional regulator, mexJK operon transcriptional repressor
MLALDDDRRSARKRRAILEGARTAFLAKGYAGTNMDEIAALASVSKRTVYQHFNDKERLFAEIVLSTTDDIDELVQLVGAELVDTQDLTGDLRRLARRLLGALMQPDLLRLRRLVIANASHFPTLGRDWYERGFERVIATLALRFEELAGKGLLRIDDPVLAANHFVGLLLWIPMNQAMFTGDDRPRSDTELNRYADAAVQAFLAGHGGQGKPSRHRPVPATGRSPGGNANRPDARTRS